MRVIKGASVAKRIRNIVVEDMKKFVRHVPNPQLNVLLVGNEPSSRWYAGAKVKLGKMLGIKVNVMEYGDIVETEELISVINNWNTDSAVNGIIIEYPLPAQIDDETLMMAVDPIKDVDGVTAVNRALLLGGSIDKAIVPATPLACIEIAKEVVPDFTGKRVIVVGRGYTVGRPLASLLLTENATVTICHSKTLDFVEITKSGEIIFVAAGSPNLINSTMVRQGAVLIDAGITEVNNQIVGDVNWEDVSLVASAASPVPGGVGTVTTSMIMLNLVKAVKLQLIKLR